MLSVCVGCLINVSVWLSLCVCARVCVKDPKRMLFSSFVVTNRQPVEKGRRDALHCSWPLTSHLSLIDGHSGRALFPIRRNDQIHTHYPDKVLQHRVTVWMYNPNWTGTRWRKTLMLLACVCFHVCGGFNAMSYWRWYDLMTVRALAEHAS